jgi:hypothetical protein
VAYSVYSDVVVPTSLGQVTLFELSVKCNFLIKFANHLIKSMLGCLKFVNLILMCMLEYFGDCCCVRRMKFRRVQTIQVVDVNLQVVWR